MVLIDDGKGTGYKASVNKANQLEVRAIVNPFLQYESEVFGNAFVWTSGIVSGAADSTLLLIKNDANGPLHIDRVVLSCASNEIFTVHLPINVSVTGTTVVGINSNTGSGNTADATAAHSETNNTQGDVYGVFHVAANSPFVYDVRGLFLDKGQSVAVDVTNGSINCSCSIHGHYIDIN